MRDVRDYKVAAGGSERLNTSSPFNIKTDSITLGSFTRDDVAALYQQHTDDTGQVFTLAAIDHAFYLTQGQPWLVNALARQVVEDVAPNPETAIAPVAPRCCQGGPDPAPGHAPGQPGRTAARSARARRHRTDPGRRVAHDVPQDDIRFVIDLGLCRFDGAGGLVIANPIYKEVLPRVLAGGATARRLPHISPAWLKPDGSLDPDKLLAAFLAFWRQHGQPLLGSVHYHEIAPHLVLMAFLAPRRQRQRHARPRVRHRHAAHGLVPALRRAAARDAGHGTQGLARRRGDPLDEGLAQLDEYLAGLGLDRGWLVIFDRRRGLPPIAQRTAVELATSPQGRAIAVIRA
jgi:hypothetical protein